MNEDRWYRMAGKRLRWPSKAETVRDCIEALRFIIGNIKKRGLDNVDCTCVDDYSCCWCMGYDAIRELDTVKRRAARLKQKAVRK